MAIITWFLWRRWFFRRWVFRDRPQFVTSEHVLGCFLHCNLAGCQENTIIHRDMRRIMGVKKWTSRSST